MKRDLKLPDFLLVDGEQERFLTGDQVLAEVAPLAIRMRDARRSSSGEVEKWLKHLEEHHPETSPYFGRDRGLPALFELEHASQLRHLVSSWRGQAVLLLLCRDFYYLVRRLSKELRLDLTSEVQEYAFATGSIFARLALLPGLDRMMISVHDHSATWTDDQPLVVRSL